VKSLISPNNIAVDNYRTICSMLSCLLALCTVINMKFQADQSELSMNFHNTYVDSDHRLQIVAHGGGKVDFVYAETSSYSI